MPFDFPGPRKKRFPGAPSHKKRKPKGSLNDPMPKRPMPGPGASSRPDAMLNKPYPGKPPRARRPRPRPFMGKPYRTS